MSNGALELTERQEGAVHSPPESRLLVLAGPGIGKTEAVTKEAFQLIF